MITNKLSDKWRHLLHMDTDTTHPGVGLYVGEEEDPTVVFQYTNYFTSHRWQLQRITLLIPAQCLTVGTYSRCLSKCEILSDDLEGHFYEVKGIHNTRGPNENKEEDRLTIIFFFYGKTTTFG